MFLSGQDFVQSVKKIFFLFLVSMGF